MRIHSATGALAVALALVALDAGGQQPPPTFPSGAQVVVLDVVATDSKGRPVADLRKEDLQVTENGQPCKILSLRLVEAAPAATIATTGPTPPPAGAAPAGGAATEATTTTAPRRAIPTRPSLVVLVFDRLTTVYAPLARKGALDLMKRAFPPDTWFAVFKVGYGTRLLAPFTTDAGRLQSAIEAATSGNADIRSAGEPELPPVTVQPEQPADQPVNPANPPIPDLRQVAEATGGEEVALSRRTAGYDSLYAVLGIARALSAVEGRKSVVYFAEGWQLPTGTRQVYDDAVSAANRANVAVNTVDARGLTSHKPEALTPMDSVLDGFTTDHRGNPGRGARTQPIEANGGLSRGGFATRGLEDREEQLTGPTMQRLADDTGGLAIADTNDLGAGLAVVAEELRQYYEVVYAPANPALDGTFRRIAVKVSRHGVRLRTRAGYFATPKRAPALAAYELPLLDALAAAAPPRDFPLNAGVLQFASMGTQRECVVLAEVPLSAVQLASDPANDAYRGHLTLLGYLKDQAGRVVARLSQDWEIEGALRQKDAARARSAVFRRTLPLPPGRYLLETAVQDRRSGGSSVARTPFEIRPGGTSLSLGSITLLELASPSSGPQTNDPLQVGSVSLVPRLGSFTAGSSTELPIFVPVYPAKEGGSVQLTIELRRDGKVLAEASPPLPPAEASGRIPWIGSIPAAGLQPGEYEITVTARQDGATASEHSSLLVLPRPKAEERPAGTTKSADPALATAPVRLATSAGRDRATQPVSCGRAGRRPSPLPPLPPRA